MKVCNQCQEAKPLEGFSKNKEYSDGLQNRCKDCARKYRQANAEIIKAKQRDKYLRVREERLAKNREYYRKNSKSIIEQKSEYNKANPDVKRKASLKRRVVQADNGTFKILDKDMRRLYASPCLYCGSTDRIQADHVIPVSRGGVNSIGNLVPCCYKCNPSKGARTIMEWRVAC